MYMYNFPFSVVFFVMIVFLPTDEINIYICIEYYIYTYIYIYIHGEMV